MFSFGRKIKLLESGFFEGFTDCHSHILPSVDDGFVTMDESLDALSYFEDLGVRKIFLTPHVDAQGGSEVELKLEKRYNELLENYKGCIQLHLAAEYMLDSSFVKHIENVKFIGSNRVLVEPSYVAPPKNLSALLYELLSAGYIPVIAHPERFSYMKQQDYEKMKSKGCQFQLNLLSLSGVYGKLAKVKAFDFLGKNKYDVVGTDIHELQRFKEIISGLKLTKFQMAQLERVKEFSSI